MVKKKLSVDTVINLIGGLCFIVMMLVTMSNMFSDWIIGKRYGQLDEIVLSFFVWVTYVGAGLLYKNSEHMSVDFLIKLLPKRLQKFSEIIVDIISFCISCLMTYYGWLLTVKSFNKRTAILKIPYTFIDLAIVIGFATLAAYIIVGFYRHIKALRKKEIEEHG